MIPPEVLTIFIWFIVGVLMAALAYVGILALGRAVARKQVNRRLDEPTTYGDDGGHPTAPETGSGRPAWSDW